MTLKFLIQIHDEVNKEKTRNELLNQMTPMRNRDYQNDRDRGQNDRDRGQSDRKKPGGGRGSNSLTSEDGWTNVPKSTARTTLDQFDATKLSTLGRKVIF